MMITQRQDIRTVKSPNKDSFFFAMRYHYEKPEYYTTMYGSIYICNHPLYDECTLFKVNDDGLAVIQQRFDEKTKHTWWGPIDPWLNDSLYLNKGFLKYFKQHGGASVNGLYPTVSLRQIMWALKMKPLKKERWETVFDRNDI